MCLRSHERTVWKGADWDSWGRGTQRPGRSQQEAHLCPAVSVTGQCQESGTPPPEEFTCAVSLLLLVGRSRVGGICPPFPREARAAQVKPEMPAGAGKERQSPGGSWLKAMHTQEYKGEDAQVNYYWKEAGGWAGEIP